MIDRNHQLPVIKRCAALFAHAESGFVPWLDTDSHKHWNVIFCSHLHCCAGGRGECSSRRRGSLAIAAHAQQPSMRVIGFCATSTETALLAGVGLRFARTYRPPSRQG
jgi:hypothetical protein